MSKTLAELRTGDPALVINTQQNNIFVAHVRRTDDTGVEVFVPEKNETQWYWLATGTADVEVAPEDEKIQAHLIADPDDWRVKALMQRKTFKQLHRMVIDATNAFRKNPDAVNSLVLSRATEAWTIFVRDADPDAIRAENLLDYVERTTS